MCVAWKVVDLSTVMVCLKQQLVIKELKRNIVDFETSVLYCHGYYFICDLKSLSLQEHIVLFVCLFFLCDFSMSKCLSYLILSE